MEVRTVARQKHTFRKPPGPDRPGGVTGARPVRDPAELSAGIWRSETELRHFIEDVYASRAAAIPGAPHPAGTKEGPVKPAIRRTASAHPGTPGSRIREVRQRRVLSLRHVAAQAGITPSYLSDIENDRRMPAWPALQRIASLVGLDAAELAALAGRLSPQTQRYLQTRPDVLRLLNAIARAHLLPD